MRNGFMYLVSSKKVKALSIAVILMVVTYAIFVQGHESVKADRGLRAAEGIEYTSMQAQDMTVTAEQVGDLIESVTAPAGLDTPQAVPTRRVPRPSNNIEVVGDSDTVAARSSGISEETAAYYSMRVETLLAEWAPRYEAATRDIDTFEQRFETAEDRLQEYFDEQSSLTDSVNDPVLREQLRARDVAERGAYKHWLEQGMELLVQAQSMRRDLNDMNAVIRKQQLTVTMLSDYSMMTTIPASVQSLHDSLEGFRSQSDELASDLTREFFNQP